MNTQESIIKATLDAIAHVDSEITEDVICDRIYSGVTWFATNNATLAIRCATEVATISKIVDAWEVVRNVTEVTIEDLIDGATRDTTEEAMWDIILDAKSKILLGIFS